MTLPNGSNNPPVSLSDINAEFGLGTNLNAYRGRLWGQDNNASGLFPSGTINISDFYSKAIVAPGTEAITTTGAGSITVKPYRTITFVLRGGGGSSGGGGGTSNDVNNCSGSSGSSGQAGTGSTFGSGAWALTAVAGGGGGGGAQNGGAAGTNGSDGAGFDGAVARAAGGAASQAPNSGGLGGGGGVASVTLTNPVLGGTGPVSGSAISCNIGSGATSVGTGGAGGNYYLVWNGSSFVPVCDNFPARAGGNGNPGANGSLAVTWTGQ